MSMSKKSYMQQQLPEQNSESTNSSSVYTNSNQNVGQDVPIHLLFSSNQELSENILQKRKTKIRVSFPKKLPSDFFQACESLPVSPLRKQNSQKLNSANNNDYRHGNNKGIQKNHFNYAQAICSMGELSPQEEMDVRNNNNYIKLLHSQREFSNTPQFNEQRPQKLKYQQQQNSLNQAIENNRKNLESRKNNIDKIDDLINESLGLQCGEVRKSIEIPVQFYQQQLQTKQQTKNNINKNASKTQQINNQNTQQQQENGNLQPQQKKNSILEESIDQSFLVQWQQQSQLPQWQQMYAQQEKRNWSAQDFSSQEKMFLSLENNPQTQQCFISNINNGNNGNLIQSSKGIDQDQSPSQMQMGGQNHRIRSRSNQGAKPFKRLNSMKEGGSVQRQFSNQKPRGGSTNPRERAGKPVTNNNNNFDFAYNILLQQQDNDNNILIQNQASNQNVEIPSIKLFQRDLRSASQVQYGRQENSNTISGGNNNNFKRGSNPMNLFMSGKPSSRQNSNTTSKKDSEEIQKISNTFSIGRVVESRSGKQGSTINNTHNNNNIYARSKNYHNSLILKQPEVVVGYKESMGKRPQASSNNPELSQNYTAPLTERKNSNRFQQLLQQNQQQQQSNNMTNKNYSINTDKLPALVIKSDAKPQSQYSYQKQLNLQKGDSNLEENIKNSNEKQNQNHRRCLSERKYGDLSERKPCLKQEENESAWKKTAYFLNQNNCNIQKSIDFSEVQQENSNFSYKSNTSQKNSPQLNNNLNNNNKESKKSNKVLDNSNACEENEFICSSQDSYNSNTKNNQNQSDDMSFSFNGTFYKPSSDRIINRN